MDELRTQLKELAKAADEYKKSAEAEIELLKREVAILHRKNEALNCFACGSMKCDKREKLRFCECGRVIR